MKRRSILSILAAMMLAAVGWAFGESERIRGEWVLHESEEPGLVRLSISKGREDNHWRHESDWPIDDLAGLDLSRRARHEVSFTVEREAGRFAFEGFLEDGDGVGFFHFTANPNFVREMGSIGFEVEEKNLYGMALADVTVRYAQDMKDAGLQGLDAQRFIAMRVHGVSLDFVEALHAAGQAVVDSAKLVRFRVHGVTPELVRELRGAGYDPSDDKLVAMQVHGATPGWIRELATLGYDGVSLERLIQFRVHGVTTEFIAELRALGYSQLEPEALVSFRVHGATPEFLQELRALDLRPDAGQVVEFRVHGVTGRYIEAMRAAGGRFSISELVRAKVHGVSPELVERARREGLTDLGLDSLLRWRQRS